jgi:hypothetical protein
MTSIEPARTRRSCSFAYRHPFGLSPLDSSSSLALSRNAEATMDGRYKKPVKSIAETRCHLLQVERKCLRPVLSLNSLKARLMHFSHSFQHHALHASARTKDAQESGLRTRDRGPKMGKKEAGTSKASRSCSGNSSSKPKT